MSKDRRRLALAMGWQRVGRTAESSLYYPPGCKSYGPMGADEPPNPFEDANDDYDVLQWMRDKWLPKQQGWPSKNDPPETLVWHNFKMSLQLPSAYKIGDYAICALSALDHMEKELNSPTTTKEERDSNGETEEN